MATQDLTPLGTIDAVITTVNPSLEPTGKASEVLFNLSGLSLDSYRTWGIFKRTFSTGQVFKAASRIPGIKNFVCVVSVPSNKFDQRSLYEVMKSAFVAAKKSNFGRLLIPLFATDIALLANVTLRILNEFRRYLFFL